MHRYRIPSVLLFGTLALSLILPLDSLRHDGLGAHVALPANSDHHAHSSEHSHGRSHGHGHPDDVPHHEHGALVESDACTRPSSQRALDAAIVGALAPHSPLTATSLADEHIHARSSPAIRFETPPNDYLGILLI